MSRINCARVFTLLLLEHCTWVLYLLRSLALIYRHEYREGCLFDYIRLYVFFSFLRIYCCLKDRNLSSRKFISTNFLLFVNFKDLKRRRDLISPDNERLSILKWKFFVL